MNDAVQELEPIPPLPPNSAVLAVRPASDRVHTILRLSYDVTHLSDDRQKLLLYMLTQGLTEFEEAIKDMNKIEVASKLGKYERAKAQKGNGQPSQ